MCPPSPPTIPQHVAIIMDGNGRWAKQRGLPRAEGHRRGAEAVRTITDAARDFGVRYLTLYAFSVENWKRPQDEVGGLMALLEFFLRRERETFLRNQTRLLTIGRTQDLPERVRLLLDETVALTSGFTEHTLVLALNYGSRTEVLDAVISYCRANPEAREVPSWESFAQHLYTRDIPDPDLVIRTSGETRLSNFLLLQAAYAEFVFTPQLWPDFGREDFAAALDAYARRERRFGLTSEQLTAGNKDTD